MKAEYPAGWVTIPAASYLYLPNYPLAFGLAGLLGAA